MGAYLLYPAGTRDQGERVHRVNIVFDCLETHAQALLLGIYVTLEARLERIGFVGAHEGGCQRANALVHAPEVHLHSARVRRENGEFLDGGGCLFFLRRLHRIGRPFGKLVFRMGLCRCDVGSGRLFGGNYHSKGVFG